MRGTVIKTPTSSDFPVTDAALALADRLETVVSRASDDGPVVELAVGNRPDVAAALAERGHAVVATDVRDRAVPEGVSFVRDDLLEPDRSVYAGAVLLYARNLPGELQRPSLTLARTVDAPLYVTTLGAEEPVIPVEREALPAETLYRAAAPDES